MKKKLQLIALAISSIILLNSCGVIFGGSKFRGQVAVKDHPNAEIYVDGYKLGNGQVTKLFPRNRPLYVEIKQEGCPSKNVTFDNTFRTGNFILSVISWGILGIAVDLGTGAAYKPDVNYNPNIQQLSVKDFQFTIDYSECKKP
jgi:hypothetical protein